MPATNETMLTDPPRSPWLETAPGTATCALPAVLAILWAGIAWNQHAGGAVAAAAAVTTGFGAYKRIFGSAGPAMGLTTAGMAVSAFLGTLAGQTWESTLIAVVAWGFACGLLQVLKSDVGWIAQQCTIVLLVAGAFPGSVAHAADRALVVLVGSAIQFLMVTVLVVLFDRPALIWPHGWLAKTAEAGSAIANEVRSPTGAFGRAVRLAFVLALAVEIWRSLQLHNGYWVGMTVLLLVRPAFRDTLLRATERTVGTIAGALLATLLSHLIPLSQWTLAGLTGGFAFLTLLLQQGNRLGSRTLTYPGSYSVFAACLTAYVVFLLDYGGLSQRGVAGERVMLTFAGGLLALVVHVPWIRAGRPVDPPRPATG